ncbi:ABC transporter permease [Dactylosporangium sp. NPDC000244]|uniref:ABC transporter permease n=1 Tax=Dactylosporangium sp. NPDC000244 TaxID=3154365 RepID=UPI0033331018
MSIATETRPSAAVPARTADPARKVTGARVLRSEWYKQWSLRSTWITLGLGLLFLLAFGTIASLRYKSMTGSGQQMDPDFADATTYSLALFGTTFATIALGVLGVLSTSGEYTTGMIRSTLAAVPRRLPVLWSKAAVYGVVAFAVGAAGAFGAFLISSGVLSGTAKAMGISADGVVTGLLGAAVYLGLVGVIGVALGALLRSTAGGISAFVGLFLLVPGLMMLLPKSWRADITPYLPSNAGESIFALHHVTGTLTAGNGLLVLLGWTALALAGAAIRLVRSDA